MTKPKEIRTTRICFIVDECFKNKVKIKCIKENMTMTEVVKLVLTNWLKDQ